MCLFFCKYTVSVVNWLYLYLLCIVLGRVCIFLSDSVCIYVLVDVCVCTVYSVAFSLCYTLVKQESIKIVSLNLSFYSEAFG